MADFIIAYNITSKHEGGYANHSADKGGETYKGIARKFWGTWNGWKYVDAVTSKYGKTSTVYSKINTELAQIADLTQMIKDFYFGNFWVKSGCTKIKDQNIANFIYDFSVNSGHASAIRELQQILNKDFGKKLLVDGNFGDLTAAAVNGITDSTKLHNLLKDSRITFVNNIVKKDASQAVFLKGWLDRITSFVWTNYGKIGIGIGTVLFIGGTLFF